MNLIAVGLHIVQVDRIILGTDVLIELGIGHRTSVETWSESSGYTIHKLTQTIVHIQYHLKVYIIIVLNNHYKI